jgi:hypothetical protein
MQDGVNIHIEELKYQIMIIYYVVNYWDGGFFNLKKN